jgi:hypothetical protein
MYTTAIAPIDKFDGICSSSFFWNYNNPYVFVVVEEEKEQLYQLIGGIFWQVLYLQCSLQMLWRKLDY